jgi:DNA-binding MarR family transcriptional regulator
MVSGRELEILKFLIDGQKYFNEIQEAIGLKKPIVSEYMSKLKEKGLVVEFPDPEDRRKKFYQLNEDELVVISRDEAIQVIREELQKVGAELSPEEENKLREVLKSMRPIFLEKLKTDGFKRENPEQTLIESLNGLAALKILSEYIPKKHLKLFAKPFKKRTKKLAGFDTTRLIDIVPNISHDFTMRWMKTDAFRGSIIAGFLGFAVELITDKKLQKEYIEVLREALYDEQTANPIDIQNVA